jgi:PAS domain S-box-containing protein
MNREKILEIIIDNLPHGFSLVDKDGVIIEFNRAAEAITGYSKSDVIGKSYLDIFHSSPDKNECHLIQYAFQQNKGVESLENTLKRKNGETIMLSVTIFPVYDSDGSFMGGVKLFRDISVQKKKERERKNVLTMFAHDMKNPVVIARGFLLRLLSNKAGEITTKQREYCVMVEDELKRLHELITDFLQFSRFEAKEYMPAFSTFDIGVELSAQIESLRVLTEKRNIAIALDIPSNASLGIVADRSMISRVIANLLDNAIKYTNPGGAIHVIITDHNDRLQVSVEDTGVGISSEHLPFIFDAFYRASKDSKGSGLGLFISKTIVEAHGGSIRAESAPLQGSTFSFTLPKRRVTDASS